MKKISIVTACYNEIDNIEELVNSIRTIFIEKIQNYTFEHIIIDNASNDGTKEVLRNLASKYKELKIIFNTRNFGHIQSPHHARMQATGDAIINIAADFQDPPELIIEFIKNWENGNKIVIGIKKKESDEGLIMKTIRGLYYSLVKKISNIEMHENFSSYCLIDQIVLKDIRKINDSYPYFRGLLSSLGYKPIKIYYKKNLRKKGVSKNNLYTLYDVGVLGITSYSKIPLRLCILVGFTLMVLTLTTGIFYFIYKLLFWESLFAGIAPLIILFTFLFSFVLLFLGVIGEYLILILSKINTVPVIEEERLNFNNE